MISKLLKEYLDHNTKSEKCWCNPKIETMPNGKKLIIHNDIKKKKDGKN